ncbi:DUF2235 domain-containing protein [Fundidesulfovibrio terrae]|uniref:DUF2235 domain-containing protein n=1 Tax=Fundidesulfovibrio terrae TaxID=2922866 RepID=UPI001FAE918B|nr:DUF2235 domain-containing protein [Fundidesulfovibrio terrae]
MAKKIIFCADGTWNGPGVDIDHDGNYDNTPTNVWKLFDRLPGDDIANTTRLADEQEIYFKSAAEGDQVSKYIHGVGDSHNPIIKILGGAAGVGIIQRIVRGYTFISRHYEPRDEIFIIGFSRGAYTARALAGLICAMGVLDTYANPIPKEKAYILGAAAWYQYVESRKKPDSSLWGRIQDTLDMFPKFLTNTAISGHLVKVDAITAVCVWDTVGALGIPQYSMDRERIDAFKFVDLTLNGKVQNGLHAVSIDDRRADFTPTLWDASAQVKQVLFAGGHADVGGGYPDDNNESDLSDISLNWMQHQLEALSVKFKTPSVEFQSIARKSQGPAHDETVENRIWEILPAGRNFSNRPDLFLHKSVTNRLGMSVRSHPTKSPEIYDPVNLGGWVSGGKVKPGTKIDT